MPEICVVQAFIETARRAVAVLNTKAPTSAAAKSGTMARKQGTIVVADDSNVARPPRKPSSCC